MKNTMKLANKITTLIKTPAVHLIFLACLLVFVYSQSTIVLMDDNVFYQKFTEKLANSGQVDFSLPGFHGGDFLTVPVYLLTRSGNSVAYLEMLLAIISIFTVYLATKEIYKNKAWGVMAAYIYLLSPFEYANPLRGHHHTSMIFMVTLGLYLLYKNNKFAWLAFGISYIIRPFAIALAPLFLYQRKFKQFFLSLIIPALYVIVEYWQIGRVQIGVHENFTPENLFSIQRVFLNLAYAFQNYFSIHSYSYLNCLGSYDMIHLSPFISFLALLGVLYHKKYFSDRRLFFALLVSAAIALVLPAAFVHLDMWYLWVFNFCLILLALPIIASHRLFPPIVAASFFFQFFYAFISYRNVYWHNYAVLSVPALIFIISLIYAFMSKTDKENKAPRVLIATGIYPPDIGGPATIVGELKKSLEENDFEVKVITYSDSQFLADDVTRINKKSRFSKFSYLFSLFKLSFSVDVIYATDTYSVGYFAYLLKKILRKPYIIRFAGDSAWETAFGNGWTTDYIVEFQKNSYDARIEKMKSRRAKILYSADKVIAVSEFMSRIAQDIGVEKNSIKVIYNSVDFEKIKPINRQEFLDKYGLSESDKIIMTACRLTPWKGVDGLIRSVKDLRQRFPAKLIVLGSGPELEKLKSMAYDLKMEDAVIFAGVINQEDMISYIGFADVFVLNTYYEGLSHTLLEAIKAKVPIIASDAGGNPEVIQSNVNGLLISYNNEDQIKKSIGFIFDNPGKAQELTKSALDQSGKFSWTDVVSKTIEVIRSIK